MRLVSQLLAKTSVRTNVITVRLESVITGHPRFTTRYRSDPKIERILYDPQIGRDVLFTEVKKKANKNLAPHLRYYFGLVGRKAAEL